MRTATRIRFAEDDLAPIPAVNRPKRVTAKDLKKTAKEADIQLAICQLLSFMGVPFSVTDSSRCWGPDGKTRQSRVEPGWPDITAVIPWAPFRGLSLFIETKAARTKFQPGQKECHEALRKAGAVVIVPRSVEEFAQEMMKVASARGRNLLEKVL